MARLLDLLGPALSGDALGHLSRTVGADEATTQRAAQAALPLLVSALGQNTNRPQGAQALDRALEEDHDGGLLDHVSGFLGTLAGGRHAPEAAAELPGVAPRAADGAGILRHVFGERLPGVERSVAQATGLDAGQVTRLLMALAPLVMSALGRMKRDGGLDAGGLSDLLGREARQTREAAPGDLLAQIGRVLDRDGDGNPLDDLSGMLGGLLGRR